MICFKNEHKSDQETYVALTRAFFTSLSPVRAALNYILAALLLAFGIYNLTAGETAWGIVMTACGLLLIALTLLYPWLMGRSVEKYAAGPVGSVARPGFYEELVAYGKAHDLLIVHDNAYSDITAIKESDRYFFLLIKGGHAVLRKGCFTVGDEAEFAAFIAEKSGLNVRRTK